VPGVILLQESLMIAFYSFVGGWHRAVVPLSRAVLLSSSVPPRIANGCILPLSERGFCAIAQYVRKSTKEAPNFLERRKGEVRRMILPRTPMHKASSRGCV